MSLSSSRSSSSSVCMSSSSRNCLLTDLFGVLVFLRDMEFRKGQYPSLEEFMSLLAQVQQQQQLLLHQQQQQQQQP